MRTHVGVPHTLDLEAPPLALELECPSLPGDRSTDTQRWETLTMPSKITFK